MGTQQRGHVVMFPFMAQGHIIPFLALAKLIDQRHRGRCTVTLVNTPLNIHNLRSSLPPDSSILLRDLPFSATDHGLPPGVENTDSLPNSLLIHLFQASATLQPHFERLVSDLIAAAGEGEGLRRPPLCIVADVFVGWTVEVARKLRVSHATFTTCGGFGTTAYFSMWQHLPHLRADPDGEFAVPGFPETFRLHRSQTTQQLRAADGSDHWSAFLREQIRLCLTSDGMLCNSVEKGVEEMGMDLLRKYSSLRVWAVGPLFPTTAVSSGVRDGRKPGISPEACLRWLDSHPARSVLYVSFGSQNTIAARNMAKLAAGLEASRRAFVWVVRPPVGFDPKEEFRDEWLPEGFEDRVGESGRGLLIRNWAPQLEILSHGSVGAFLSHCGWNSVLESLSQGVPLVGWPIGAEQFYNCKMAEEELGVCVELARGAEGDLTRAAVQGVVASVIGGGRGEDMRRRAAGLAERIRAATVEEEEGGEKGPSLVAVDDFIETALKWTTDG